MSSIIKKLNKSVMIIAEVSANHKQDFNLAVRLIKKAKECGADAVKFQTYTPDTMTIDIDNRYFGIKHPKWGNQTLYQLYQKAYTPWHWFKKLKRVADDIGIMFFSTAYDRTAVDLLEEIDVPVHKISSFELVDLPLIKYAARTKKPIIMSTGLADLHEIRRAVDAAKKAGAKDIILLKCVSNYPAEPETMNLNTIPHMKKFFKCPIGFSDHTLGIAASITAVSLGARLIEKHFTLSRKINTLDNFYSTEPAELRELVKNVRIAEKALGKVYYGLTSKSRKRRRSLFIIKDMRKGETLIYENVKSIRPGDGLAPKYLDDILGRKIKKDIKKGTPLSWKVII